MNKPKILIYDIETSPVLAWIWRCGPKIRIGHEQIRAGQKFDIICICWKWLHEREVHSLDWGLEAQDSTKMIEEFTKVIEEADVVIAHNGDQFDAKQLNTQRLLKGLRPISWPTSEDTLKSFRKHFAMPSYRLDYLAKLLTGSGKDPMNFQDWIDIVEGKSRVALDRMIRYCKKDVRKLAAIFRKAEPHLTPKANRALIMHPETSSVRCPGCGAIDSISKGHVWRRASRLQRRICTRCGHNFYRKVL